MPSLRSHQTLFFQALLDHIKSWTISNTVSEFQQELVGQGTAPPAGNIDLSLWSNWTQGSAIKRDGEKHCHAFLILTWFRRNNNSQLPLCRILSFCFEDNSQGCNSEATFLNSKGCWKEWFTTKSGFKHTAKAFHYWDQLQFLFSQGKGLFFI